MSPSTPINQLNCQSCECFTVEGIHCLKKNNLEQSNLRSISNRDTLVPPEWGQKTFEELKKRGVEGEYTSLKNTLHELKKSELLELEKWLCELLPPHENDLQNKL